jgi:hypothetical protein
MSKQMTPFDNHCTLQPVFFLLLNLHTSLTKLGEELWLQHQSRSEASSA